MGRRISRLQGVGTILLVFLTLTCVPENASATESTLGRLSFWVLPTQKTQFAQDYRNKVTPILSALGFKPSHAPVPVGIDSTISYLFEFASPKILHKAASDLDQNDRWRNLLRDLGSTYGTIGSKTSPFPSVKGLIRYAFDLYTAPVGPGVSYTPDPSPGRWHKYGIIDGLPTIYILSALEDREGDLWFGSWEGVVRFDGQRFTVYTTKDGLGFNGVWCMLEDRKGNLWFGTRDRKATQGSGVTRYTPGKKGATWTTFTTKDGLVDDVVFSCLEDRDGNLWFGTRKGVSCYNPVNNTWQNHTPEDGLPAGDVWTILQDREGTLWFGTDGGGIGCFHPSADPNQATWTHITSQDGLASDYVMSSLEDREGNIWIGTRGRLLCRYDPKKGEQWTTFTAKDGLQGSSVRSLCEDRDGRIFVGTNGGIHRYDPQKPQTGPMFEHFDQLTSGQIQAILQDREGTYWFLQNGIARYEEGTFVTFTSNNGLAHDVVRSMMEDREGNVWVGTSRFDGTKWITFSEADGLTESIPNAMLEDRSGKIWFGLLSSGVSRYDPSPEHRQFRNFTAVDGLAYDRVFGIVEDMQNNIYFAAGMGYSSPLGIGRGLSRFDPRKGDGPTAWTTLSTPDGLIQETVLSTYRDRKDRLWFGTWGGLSCFDPHTNHWTSYTTADGLVDNQVMVIYEDPHSIFYFGTWGKGVSRFDPQKTGADAWTTITTADGLTNNDVDAIFTDTYGHLWFGTWGGGVSRYDGTVFQTMTTADGLVSNDVSQMLMDQHGAIWIGTWNGVTRYKQPTPVPPRVSIDAVVADRRSTAPEALKFPSTVGVTAFEFHGQSIKTRADGFVYRYRLVGLEKDWQTTKTPRVEYRNLPRGNYTFEILAVDRDLVYSNTPATVALTVHLPYERIGWMSALTIAIILISWQTTRVIARDRKLHIANAELTEANAEIRLQTERKSAFLASMGHELRTPMNAIKGFTSLVMRREKTLSERGQENLGKVAQASDYLLAMINDLMDLSKIEAGRMDVNPERFKVPYLVASCLDTVSPLVKESVEMHKEIGEDVDEAFTDQNRLRQMLINLLSNAIKFTDEGSVTLSAGIENDMLILSVSDTGKGIPADAIDTIFDEYRQVKGQSESSVQKGTGLGLSITKKFAELLGGTISVSSEMGKGSTFTVRIPAIFRG